MGSWEMHRSRDLARVHVLECLDEKRRSVAADRSTSAYPIKRRSAQRPEYESLLRSAAQSVDSLWTVAMAASPTGLSNLSGNGVIGQRDW